MYPLCAYFVIPESEPSEVQLSNYVLLGFQGPKDRTMGRWLVDRDLAAAQATLDKFAVVAIMETFGR